MSYLTIFAKVVDGKNRGKKQSIPYDFRIREPQRRSDQVSQTILSSECGHLFAIWMIKDNPLYNKETGAWNKALTSSRLLKVSNVGGYVYLRSKLFVT